MASATSTTLGVASFQRHLSTESIDSSITYLTTLLKRRQIRGSKRCAVVTTLLLLKTVETAKQADSELLIARVKEVGKRLIDAAPHEPSIGNIVRRVLGIIREEDEDDAAGRAGDDSMSMADDSELGTPSPQESPFRERHGLSNGLSGTVSPRHAPSANRPPLLTTRTGIPENAPTTRPITSMFSINAHPTMRHLNPSSPFDSPQRSGAATPHLSSSGTLPNLRPEIIHQIKDLIEEISGADDEIASAWIDQIGPGETILTYGGSLTVQRFLLRAATKRKFSVFVAEGYPNQHHTTQAVLTGSDPDIIANDMENLPNDTFSKPLTSAGATVILIPDSAIFAVMSRVNKVILDTHAVLSNGSLIAPSGTNLIVKAAKFHRVPVVVLAATYKLSLEYPYDSYKFIEYGDPSLIIPSTDSELRNGVVGGPGGVKEGGGLRNALFDYVEGKDVDLFVTNLVPSVVGTGFMYRVVRDQFREEDLVL
jgi:translation initiation factor eIF-2B subunit beta